MSILKLAKIINSNQKAGRKFQEERWKRGFGCVKCGSIRAWKHRKLKNGLQKYRCEDCRHVFSDQSTTLLRWNKINITQVAIINHVSSSKLSIKEIAREAEVNKNSALRLRRIIQKAKGKLYCSMTPPELTGVIEMDETKIAGRWFWGALERKTGKAIIEMVPNRSETVLSAKIWKHVKEGSALFTDEWAGYQPHPSYYQHFTVNHSKEFVRKECKAIHTNTIEGLWRQLKRRIHDFANGVKLDHIQDYIYEYFYLKNYDHFQKPTFFPLYCQKS